MPLSKIDRRLGVVLGALGAAVCWSGSRLPAVPGQKLGAGFLPILVGAGLMLCAGALYWRGLRGGGPADASAPPSYQRGDTASAAVIVTAVLACIALSDTRGFLLIAPLCLLASFLALGVRARAAIGWALLGTPVVHLTFHELLRVPLPWGLLRPLY